MASRPRRSAASDAGRAEFARALPRGVVVLNERVSSGLRRGRPPVYNTKETSRSLGTPPAKQAFLLEVTEYECDYSYLVRTRRVDHDDKNWGIEP